MKMGTQSSKSSNPQLTNVNSKNLNEGKVVAIADLHGNKKLLLRALDKAQQLLGTERIRVVTLGDYADNGPDVPGLFDALISLESDPRFEFFPILGNHD